MSSLKRKLSYYLHYFGTDFRLSTLKTYVGVSNGRRVRRAIEELREEGDAIGSSARRGYFIIRTKKDWEDAVGEFHAKAMACLRMKSRLEKIGTDMFNDQRKLDFAGQGERDDNGSESAGDQTQG